MNAYLLLDEDAKYFKVGITSSLRDRIATLNSCGYFFDLGKSRFAETRGVDEARLIEKALALFLCNFRLPPDGSRKPAHRSTEFYDCECFEEAVTVLRRLVGRRRLSRIPSAICRTPDDGARWAALARRQVLTDREIELRCSRRHGGNRLDS